MSRFKPSPFEHSAVASFPTNTPAVATVALAPQPPLPTPPQELAEPTVDRPTGLDKVGYILFCTYIISGHINEWTLRLLSSKAYISTVLLFTLPVVFLLSRHRLRGL